MRPLAANGIATTSAAPTTPRSGADADRARAASRSRAAATRAEIATATPAAIAAVTRVPGQLDRDPADHQQRREADGRSQRPSGRVAPRGEHDRLAAGERARAAISAPARQRREHAAGRLDPEARPRPASGSHSARKTRWVPARPFSSSSRPSSKLRARCPPAGGLGASTSETRISPPPAWAAIRAARITFLPKKSPSSAITSPVCRPIRTRRVSASRPRLALREGALDLDRALERLARIGEGEHEAVALALHLVALVAADLLAEDRVVLAQHLEPALVAEPLGEDRRVLDVAEEDRHGAVGRGVGAQVGPLGLDRGDHVVDRGGDVDPGQALGLEP